MTEWTEAMTGNGCTWIERDEVFEEYARGMLGHETRDAFEAHYFACDACFHKVHTSLDLRAELAALPADLPPVRLAARLSWRWWLAPAAATCVLVVAAAIWFQNPALPASPAIVTDALPATAPAAAPAMPAPGADAPTQTVTEPEPAAGSPDRPSHTVRNSPPATSAVVLLSPSDNETRTPDKLDFSWRSVPGALYYDLHIVTEEGNVVWSGKAEGTSTSLPDGHGLQAGPKYFVWVRAHLSGGGTVKSPAVPFRVSGQ